LQRRLLDFEGLNPVPLHWGYTILKAILKQ